MYIRRQNRIKYKQMPFLTQQKTQDALYAKYTSLYT